MDAATLQRIAADPAVFQESLIIPGVRGACFFGTVLADFQRERFAGINGALVAIARGKKPPTGRHFWEATKGASKDSDLAVCLLWLLAFTSRPLSCQVGAADRDQADEMKKAAKDILRLNPWLATRIEIQQWRIICEATGSECSIIPADTAGSHGARPDVLILNELSHVTKQEFAENLLDNTAKVPRGLVVIATNAGHRGGWQYRWRELARTSSDWLFHQVSEPAPWLDASHVEEARRRNSNSRFLRLFHGIWSAGLGDALDEADISAAIDKRLTPMAASQVGYYFVAGLDLGIRHDHSALVVLACHGQTQRLRLAECKSWAPSRVTKQVDLEEVERAVLNANQRFHFGSCGFDPYQAALMAQRLSRRNVHMSEVVFSGKNLDSMASTLLDVFRSRRIDMYDEPRLVADLQRLTIVEKSYGYKLEAVRDESGHADTATALAIALLMSKSAPQNGGLPWGGVIRDFDLSAPGMRFAEPVSQLTPVGPLSLGPRWDEISH